MVRKQGLSMEDAGNVVQNAFILALGKLDASRSPKAWLYQVVDLAVNWQRKIQRRASLLAKWDSASSTDYEGSKNVLAETLLLAGRPREAEIEILAAIPTIEKERMVEEGFAALNLLRESVHECQTDLASLRALRERMKGDQQ